jgi:hypothetical protein
VLQASAPPGSTWQLVHAVAFAAKEFTPGTVAGVPAWHCPHALGSVASSIADQRSLRSSVP